MKKLLLILLAFSAIVCVFFLLFGLCEVKGDAMSPAIKDKQKALVWRPGKNYISRGDVVMYNSNCIFGTCFNDGDTFSRVGRVIGLPNENIWFEGEKIYFQKNDRKFSLVENYTVGKLLADKDGFEEKIELGESEYFILSDKRDKKVTTKSQIVNKKDVVGVLFFVEDKDDK
ncbi:MAG: signal peptidase I [Patescibacteria group bacterium]